MWREFEVADILSRQRLEQAATIGWFAASYVWRKDLPNLHSELAKFRRRTRAQQTNEELLFVLQGLSAQLGVPLQHRPRKTKER